MARNKVLVIGDSFAQLDPVHSHWAKFWANKYHLDTDHFGIPGGNHVSIVSSFLHQTIDYSNVRAVLYFVTDMIRSERTSLESSSGITDREYAANLVDTIFKLTFDENENENLWEQLYCGLCAPGTSFNWGEYEKLLYSPNTVLSSSITENIDFYRASSLPWIMKANYNSMQLLLTQFEFLQIPVCIVNTNWRQGNELHVKYSKAAHQWDAFNLHSTFSINTAYSNNHVDTDDAIIAAIHFDLYTKKYNIFENLRESNE